MRQSILINFTFKTLKMHLLFSNVVRWLTFKSKSSPKYLTCYSSPQWGLRVDYLIHVTVFQGSNFKSKSHKLNSSPSQVMKSRSHNFKSSPTLISSCWALVSNSDGLKLKTWTWDFCSPGSKAQVQVQLSSWFLKPKSPKFKLNPQVQVKS